MMLTFPNNFLWGAAASAPQTESHSLVNGKSPSTWDKWFEMNPELFHKNEGPESAPNIYENFHEDVKKMVQVGLNSYRTSISWTRLLPDGKHLNKEAVKFYREYFKELKKNGIQLIVNLFHFDLPWWLMKKGGWEARESISHFVYFAKNCFELFGDLVDMWTTFNEPIVHIECGYLYGYHYPAVHNLKKAIQVGYHTLMAHVFTVEMFRKLKPDGKIGIILNISPCYSRSESMQDMKAKKIADLLNIKSFLDPCVLGVIPKDLIDLLKENFLLPEIKNNDLLKISENRVDFIGVNYYQPRRVKMPEIIRKPAKDPNDFYLPYDWPDKKINKYRGWEIYPKALLDIAIMIKDEYENIPWYVSENGMGVADEDRFLDKNDIIQDNYRIDFIRDHLKEVYKGIELGSNCFGYHVWTFVDCWSWLNGYKNRYGLYRIDITNGNRRTLKMSGLWYGKVIKDNGFYE